MKNMDFPKKQLLILVGICTAALVLAVFIGLINKGSNNSPMYEVEGEQVTK